MRKWITNDYELQQKINNFETDHFGSEQCETNLTDTKVLGVNWETQSDKLVFSLTDIIKEALSYEGNIMKRYDLKVLSSVFDPLCVLSPAVVKLKILFQDLCCLKIDWDTHLSELLIIRWKKILQDLPSVDLNSIQSIQLHVFCDACAKAYGAAVYLRAVHENGLIFTNFVASKTKVAPIKETTIPQLELLSCFILSRLLKTLLEALNYIVCLILLQ